MAKNSIKKERGMKEGMSSFVGLNVGGKVYRMTRETLVSRDPDSFFALIMSERIPSSKDSEGNFLIDRDGEVFREVLQFLRDGDIITSTWRDLRMLAKEADFFQLQSLQERVDKTLKNPYSFGLNVGGVIQRTSKETLTTHPNSLLADLCQDHDDTVHRDEHGNLFLDRDGAIFRHVLNFLRNGRLILPDGFDELALLACEADFYRLPMLREHVESLLTILKYDKTNVAILDIFQPDRKGNCVVYTNADDVLSLLAFIQNPSIKILDTDKEACDIRVDTLLGVVKTTQLSLNPSQWSECLEHRTDDLRWHLLNQGNFKSRKSRRTKSENPVDLSDISKLLSEHMPLLFSNDVKLRHLKEVQDESRIVLANLHSKSNLKHVNQEKVVSNSIDSHIKEGFINSKKDHCSESDD